MGAASIASWMLVYTFAWEHSDKSDPCEQTVSSVAVDREKQHNTLKSVHRKNTLVIVCFPAFKYEKIILPPFFI
jgi:hypothetical protein